MLENSTESDIAGTQSECKGRVAWRWAGPGPTEGSGRPLSQVGSPTVSPGDKVGGLGTDTTLLAVAPTEEVGSCS